jgi:hypothetical protein
MLPVALAPLKRIALRGMVWGLAVATLGAVTLKLTSRLWTGAIGRALVCHEQLAPSDAILIENFDPDYLSFERAAALQKAGLAARVLVPGQASPDPNVPNPVSLGFVEVMSRVARLQHVTYIPVREREPFAFGVAHQVRSFLLKNGIRSIILVSPGFRSRRSFLVYQAALGGAGVRVGCSPAFPPGGGPETWLRTWHGVQNVVEQFGKLQYYHFYVLPFASPAAFDNLAPAPGLEIGRAD